MLIWLYRLHGDDFIRKSDVARLLGVSTRTIDRHAKDRDAFTFTAVGNHAYTPLNQVIAVLATCGMSPGVIIAHLGLDALDISGSLPVP